MHQLQAGDTLVIQPGTYTERIIISDIQGLPDAPITIRGENAEDVIFEGGCMTFPCDITEFHWDFAEWEMARWDLSWELDGFISIRNSQHLILSNLTVQNVAMEGVHIESGSHLVVHDIEVDGTGNGGIIAIGVNHLIIDGNYLHNNQLGYLDKRGDPQIGYHEALSVIASENFEVSNNILNTILKEGIDIKEGANNGAVYDNVVEYACSIGIYINEADDIQVFGNTVRHSGFWLLEETLIPCNEDPIYGEAFDSYFGTGILIAVGDLGDVGTGQLSNISFYSNVVDHTHDDCIQFWDEWSEHGFRHGKMTDIQIYNNTLVDCGLAGVRVDDAESVSIVNNIIALTAENPIVGNAVEASDISHNLFQLRFDWQTASGDDVLIGDPLFVDTQSGDFHLQGNSPAVDAGRDVDLLYTGNEPDLGAFELP